MSLATDKEKQGISDICTILDYYTKSALSHSGHILVCFFGIFSILTVLKGLNQISDRSTFLLTYAVFVWSYALIVSFGLYEIRRWKFYSSRAKYIADFIKGLLRSNSDFVELFCKVLEEEDEAKKDEEWYKEKLLVNEWVAVGKEGEEQKRPFFIYWVFDHVEWAFFLFCTIILAGLFVGIYNGGIVNALTSRSFLRHPFLDLWIIIFLVYAIILIAAGLLLRKVSGMIK